MEAAIVTHKIRLAAEDELVRAGSHPLKKVGSLESPADITVQMVTFIPFQEGYFEKSLDVLKLSLESLWEHTSGKFDLMIFDNGSCAEVRSYLLEQQERDKIQYLFLSDRNVGLPGAWNILFRAAPGKIVAYSDSDIYFYPGWLEEQLHLLETFPKVGMVTGIPLRNPQEFSSKTLEWAEQEPQVAVSRGVLQDWDIFWAHAQSLGLEEAEARTKYQKGEDVQFTLNGATAFLGAGHFQFVSPRSVLEAVMPFPYIMPMGNERYLDKKINELGYLRLSTTKMFVRHIGNRVPEALLREIGRPVQPIPSAGRRSWVQRVANWAPIRKLLLFLYGRIFRLYYIREEGSNR